MNIKIAPSILAADFSRLADEVKGAEDAGADLIHVDVMDGQFVQQITIGAPVVEAIRKCTKLPLDVHLMVLNPEKQIRHFINAGADNVTVHLEATAFDYAQKQTENGYVIFLVSKPLVDMEKCAKIIDEVHKAGKKISFAINPDTPCELLFELTNKIDMVLVMTVWPGAGAQKFIESTIDKIRKLKVNKANLELQVDGGINSDTIEIAGRNGANVFVAGTAIFKAKDKKEAIKILRTKAEKFQVN